MAQGLAPEVAAPSPGRYRGAVSVDQNRARSKRYRAEGGAVQPEVSEALKRPFNLNNRKPKKGPYPGIRDTAPLL